jgi:quercetin dioxygenase-like cupin family protein
MSSRSPSPSPPPSPSPSPIAFAEVEWLAKTPDVGVRINTLSAGQGTPWHFHSAVTDDVFCLEGELEVACRGPDEVSRLCPGERVRVTPGRVHRVVNRTHGSLRYLLVQATGPYDFNVVDG